MIIFAPNKRKLAAKSKIIQATFIFTIRPPSSSEARSMPKSRVKLGKIHIDLEAYASVDLGKGAPVEYVV